MTRPPVVLLHGLGSTSEHGWRAHGWIDLLADAGREVIPIDLPGHGASPRSADPDDYTDVAAEVARRFARREAVEAIGFSAGARLLIECAARDLASFERIALLGVGPASLGSPGEGAAALAEALAAGDESQPAAQLMLRMIRRAGNDPAAVSAFLRRPVAEITGADLAAVTCPVLVVTGERDPAGSAAELAAMLPDAAGVAIPGADHYAVQGDARAMDAALRFLGV